MLRRKRKVLVETVLSFVVVIVVADAVVFVAAEGRLFLSSNYTKPGGKQTLVFGRFWVS